MIRPQLRSISGSKNRRSFRCCSNREDRDFRKSSRRCSQRRRLSEKRNRRRKQNRAENFADGDDYNAGRIGGVDSTWASTKRLRKRMQKSKTTSSSNKNGKNNVLPVLMASRQHFWRAAVSTTGRSRRPPFACLFVFISRGKYLFSSSLTVDS